MKQFIILSLVLISFQVVVQSKAQEIKEIKPLLNNVICKTEELANDFSNPRSQNSKNNMRKFFNESSNDNSTQKRYQQRDMPRRSEQLNRQIKTTKNYYSPSKTPINSYKKDGNR